MLQPETIERGRDLRLRAHLWLLMMIELEGTATTAQARDALQKLAEHLDAWRCWAEDLEKELTTP